MKSFKSFLLEADYNPIKISRFSKSDRIYDIWNQYANAMAKRRPDSVLPIERFEYYIMNYAGMFKYKDSYIFGRKINDFFIPSHFAPKSMKEGVEMLKDLKKYDNIIFVVTEDLASMLKKLGYKQLPHTVKKNFNNVLTDKKILISSFKHIQRLVKLMLTYLMGNDIQPMNIDLEEHGVREYEPPTVWDKQTTRKVRVKRIVPMTENLDSFVDDERYFDIAWRTLEDKSQEEDLLLYPMMGDTEFDINQHMFQDETEVRNEIYEKLDDIAKGIKSNMKNGKVRIYRGLSAKDMQKRIFEGNLKWESWSLDENIARNFSGYNSSSNKTNNTNSWLLIGLVELKDIDFDLIVDRWINFPEEYEIPVKNPMNVEIEEIWNLSEDKVYKKVKVDKDKNVIEYK
jgi:hypothetical protein